MPTYSLPNIQTGGSSSVDAPSLAAAESQAQAAGTWNPGAGTFGANSSPSSGGGGGGGGGGNTDLSALSAAFNAAGTMSQKDLDERKREFDAQLAWQQQMWQNQGLPQLVIQQKTQQLQQDEFNFEQQMAQQNMALQTAGVTGTFNGSPTLAGQQQAFQQGATAAGLTGVYNGAPTLAAQQLGLQQQQTALDALKTAASLGGPADWLAAANFGRGVATTAVPQFLRQLQTGAGTAVLGGPTPGATAPAAQSMGTLSAGMGGPAGGPTSTAQGASTPGGATPDASQAANAVRQLFSAGGQALSPQALEGLTTSERQMLMGAGQTLGFDPNTLLDQYGRSRIGQGAAQPTYSA